MNADKQLACGTTAYRLFSLDRALQGIASAGLRNVELGSITSIPGYCEHVMPEHMDDRDIRLLQEKLGDHGLTAVSIGAHSNIVTLEGVEAVKRRIDLAAMIGASIVNTGTGRTNDEEAIGLFFKNIVDLGHYASEKGVIIALEPTKPFMCGADDAREALARINLDSVRINYDTANVIWVAGLRPEEDIKGIAEYVAHVHLKDKVGGKGVLNFRPLGEGEIDFAKVIAALDGVNYRGPYSIEIELENLDTPEKVDQVVKTSAQYARSICELTDCETS